MILKLNHQFAWVLCLIILASSCSLLDNENENPEDTKLNPIEIGVTIEVASSTISTSGGSVVVTQPDTPIEGMEISIPSNSFTTPQTFKVSYSEIKSHDFGQNFNPISPMITVSNEGGYSADLMKITIPIKVPEGHFPLGFYFDETTGKLEGIPVLNYSSNTITLLTRHFLPGSKLHTGASALKSANAETGKGANIIISSISESVLNLQPIIASGFKPGVDDWEFINFGSYMAPGGHCAGQNMTAMWYYFEKKTAEGKLFNRFSENANLWQDNARGYRFCSVIHEDLVWDGTVATIFGKYIDKNQEADRLKLLTIAGAMLVTGEPQGIGIYRQTGTKTDGTPRYGGHDLICYQVSVSDGKLFISDPNTPATGQVINFVNNKFQPYMAKLNGEDASNPYPFVTYYAKTAYIEWNKIGNRWAEVLNNSIGNIAPNAFPTYTIWVSDGAGFELKDGLTVTKDTLTTNIISQTAEVFYTVQNKRLIGSTVFDESGKMIDKGTNQYTSITKLKPGANKLGYYIYGWRTSSKKENGEYRDKFVDFKWITINYAQLVIDPNPLTGEPAKEYKLTAMSKGTAPKSSRFVWDFGDGTSSVTMLNDSTVKHTFAKEGIFNVKVELYDNSSNKKIAEATATATISKAGDLLAKLKKTIAFNLEGSLTFSRDNPNWVDINTSFSWPYSSQNPIVWNNNEFKLNYKNEEEFDSNGFKSNYYHSVTGTVSADAKKIVSLIYEERFEYYRYYEWFETHVEKITITDIPLIHAIGDIEWGWGSVDNFLYKLEANQAKTKISFCEWSWKDKDGKTEVLGVSKIKQFDSPIQAKFMEKFPY
jgi:hypothetical protein